MDNYALVDACDIFGRIDLPSNTLDLACSSRGARNDVGEKFGIRDEVEGKSTIYVGNSKTVEELSCFTET